VDVIACHIEADFDALASMLAARHLYPEARLVFPGAQERVVRAFVAEGYVPDLPVVSVREIEIGAIRRLILVDTRRADRVGALGPVAARPDVELHVYDHHPPVHDDLHGRVDVSRPVGANTTLMLGVLRERGIIIGPEEATLCLLGIYHETGCLTYEGTTPEDCEAAARLLRAGADLGIVARFLPGDLDAAQIALLDELLQGAAHIDVHGADVVLTQASTERHVVGLGEIASRAAGILGARAFFALVRMTDRVFVAGRSRDPAVNSGRIATALGGGGHAAAAAATVKDRTLIEVREALMEALRANVIPAQRARDCMTPEPQTVDPQTPMVEIAGILERRHFDTLPVVKGERLVGLISRQTVERAVHHGLGDSPVEPYMATEFTALTPEAAVEEIERVMVAHHQRLVPILRGGGLVGVVTRQNLLGLAEEAEAGEEIARGGGAGGAAAAEEPAQAHGRPPARAGARSPALARRDGGRGGDAGLRGGRLRPRSAARAPELRSRPGDRGRRHCPGTDLRRPGRRESPHARDVRHSRDRPSGPARPSGRRRGVPDRRGHRAVRALRAAGRPPGGGAELPPARSAPPRLQHQHPGHPPGAGGFR
jgi:tRNA nucleotidyltransferase (CCA-adding enzyme)